MSINEGERYLSHRRGPLDAFAQVNLWHLSIGDTPWQLKTLSGERMSRVIIDYVMAATAFFANRSSDTHLREIGETSWTALNEDHVILAYVSDMDEYLTYKGLPPDYAEFINPSKPNFIFVADPIGPMVHEDASLTIPPDLIVTARQDPIEALADFAMVFSKIEDFMNERFANNDRFWGKRAAATQAQFLLEVRSQNPLYLFSDPYERIITQYPQGIASLPPLQAFYSRERKVSFKNLRNN